MRACSGVSRSDDGSDWPETPSVSTVCQLSVCKSLKHILTVQIILKIKTSDRNKNKVWTKVRGRNMNRNLPNKIGF